MRPIGAQLCTVETNGWNELDHSRGWITVRDRSRPDMDRDRIWMDDRRWMAGDGSREMDQGRRMTINLLSYIKLRSYNRALICRHTVFQRHGSTEYDTERYSEHYSEIPNYAATCPSSHTKYDSESHSYNADTAHHEAVRY